MLFNSTLFIAFALCFFACWHALRWQRARLMVLVAASLLFYGYWDWRFVFLLLISGLVDFTAGLFMARTRAPRKRAMLCGVSVAINLFILGSFKYMGFVAQAIHDSAALLGLDIPLPGWAGELVLPVGISFYTFQSMSYTIDIYLGRLQPTTSPLRFFAYLAMFPQLVAGPIERAGHILPQLEQRRTPTAEQCRDGWSLLALGYFKKSVLADNLAPFVDQAFAHASASPNGLTWWLVAAMFAAQIYCDFSGYTDIARGLAKLMGIDLMINFDQPYLATSFRNFWQRWHISLSTWFRDYIYIPLGGRGRGEAHGHLAMWLTMLASGLWHGAGWTFVLWGALHAAYLSVERITRWPRRLHQHGAVGVVASQLAVLAAVLLGWIVFRAESIGQAARIVATMLDPRGFGNPLAGIESWSFALIALAVGVVHLAGASLARVVPALGRARRLAPILAPVQAPVLIVLTIYFRGPGHAFIYFQF